ncbi:MAG: CofH family radical SAM protein [Chloroflexi bacterium]|nr:CofH family radical SAM protein [Chloroflexota bacterium]MCH8222724.1 CofH family radical SAM protein [Chloroflexota bacterium]
MLDIIREKVANAERISDEEGLFLLSEAELLDLAPLAQEWRWRHNPEPIVTFVVDTNLNYTNVCNAYCGFCAFYRPSADDPSAYTLSVEQILQKIERASGQGVTTVLMQGGLNDDLDMDYYVELVRQTRERFPHITPHYFSAPEIMEMTKVSGKSIAEVISVLREAGQRTMPGGGSEILADGVKAQVSKLWPKAAVSDWTDVHREAHRQGWMTTATMMYGHVERDEDIVESLRHIREVQDDAADQPGGFTAFIPWSFKKQNTALAPKVADEAGANRYVRMIALARIFLDNVPHIQGSWFSDFRRPGQVSLHFGADDFGGTLFDETVMLEAGHYNRTTVDEVKTLISDAGFAPAQRTTEYEIVERYEMEPSTAEVIAAGSVEA